MNVVFPALFDSLMARLAVLEFDFVGSLGLRCKFSDFDYIDALMATTLGPLLIVALLALHAAGSALVVKIRRELRQWRQARTSAALAAKVQAKVEERQAKMKNQS